MKHNTSSIEPATFPPPSPQRGDATGSLLLFDAARLSLRSGATPFRSLGRLSVVPRPYQFVPLVMDLRHDPVRLLIADDVGVGKTIEAAMIVRELQNLVRRLFMFALKEEIDLEEVRGQKAWAIPTSRSGPCLGLSLSSGGDSVNPL